MCTGLLTWEEMYEFIYLAQLLPDNENLSTLKETFLVFFTLSVLYSAQNKSNLKIVPGLELFRFNLVQR